jgi:hypothetical protein
MANEQFFSRHGGATSPTSANSIYLGVVLNVNEETGKTVVNVPQLQIKMSIERVVNVSKTNPLQVNDKVIVGYLDGHLSTPVILGRATYRDDGALDVAHIEPLSPLLIGLAALDQVPILDISANSTKKVAIEALAREMPQFAPQTMFRNAIINGDFRINQRGFSSSTTDSTYGFDRWAQWNFGGTVTMSSQSFTAGSPVATGYEASTFCRLTSASQTSSTHYAALVQYTEDVRILANSTVTISFWAKASSGTPSISVEAMQNFGTGGSPSSNVWTYLNKVTITTSWTRYSITASIPSISGKTVGTTANTSSLAFVFWTSAGSDYNSRTGSLGLQNTTIDFWGVQVERGSYATPFERRPIGTELALCQRYYETTNTGTTWNTPYVNITGSTNGYSEFITYIKFAVPKRTTAYTMTGYRYDVGIANAWWLNRSGYSWVQTPTFDIKTINGCRGYAGGAGATWVACEAFPLWSCSDEF